MIATTAGIKNNSILASSHLEPNVVMHMGMILKRMSKNIIIIPTILAGRGRLNFFTRILASKKIPIKMLICSNSLHFWKMSDAVGILWRDIFVLILKRVVMRNKSLHKGRLLSGSILFNLLCLTKNY